MNLTKAALWVFLINIISKILGLLKETILAYKFGTSFIVDAYTVAITFPSIIFAVFAGGIAESFIPVIAGIDTEKDRIQFTNNVMIITSIVSIAMTIICIVFYGEIVELLAPGFGIESKELAGRFIFLISFIFPVMMAFNIIVAYLTSEEFFIATNVCNFIITNIILIVSIYIATPQNTDVLIIGYIVSYIVPLVCLLVYAYRKAHYRFRIVVDLRSQKLRELVKLSIPLGLSLIINQINAMVGRAIASYIGPGIIAALNYANKVQLIFFSLTTSIVMSICYPRINKHFAKQDFGTGMYYVQKGFMITSLFGVPICVALFIFAKPITEFIFERGIFASDSTLITSECLAYYAIGIPFYSYREILLRALAAYKKQNLILKNTAIAIAVNILCSIILMETLEHIGIALATSIAGIVASVLMYYDLKRLNLVLFNKENGMDIIKICIATIITIGLGVITYFCISFFIAHSIAFLIACFLMVMIYIYISFKININIFVWILGMIFKRRVRSGGIHDE